MRTRNHQRFVRHYCAKSHLGLSNPLRSWLAGWSTTVAREVAIDGITSYLIISGRIQSLDQKKAAPEGRTVKAVREESPASIQMRRYGRSEQMLCGSLPGERASLLCHRVHPWR